MKNNIDSLCINTIRTLSIDAIQKADSGHPGLPMGAAPMAYSLWQNHLKHNPTDPDWANRDRFVLSPGHGSMLIYSLLHLTGYNISLDDIKSFRQLHSLTPGHPEYCATKGVEATTGPLGQGAANAVGMAMAERYLAHVFNRPGFEIVNHHTYALVSDGDIMEGISAEAASLAGHLKLGKLIYLYDSNDITLDGPASLAFSEDVEKRYLSYGWQVIKVKNGNTDIKAINAAIKRAKNEKNRPSIIIIKTTIGYGSPNKQGTSNIHGSPLGKDEIALTKKKLGFDPDQSFYIPEKALKQFRKAIDKGKINQSKWNKLFDSYAKKHPELAKQWKDTLAGILPEGWEDKLPIFDPKDSMASRQSSGSVLNALAPKIPTLFGGDADLSCSTCTLIKDGGSFDGKKGRNIHFGIREHAMAAIVNGICYHGQIRPYAATFFSFADYMRPSIRLAAMNELAPIYIWTHDSVGLGEDGPTHQPIEQLMSLRAMPNMTMIRPCDANEVSEAWRFTLKHTAGPVGIVLSRQKLPTLDRTNNKFAHASGLHKGAYILSEATTGSPRALLIATGSEVHIALKAQTLLENEGISTRVISMPSWEIFKVQEKSYKDHVLPPNIKCRISIEAGATFGWERWVGTDGIAIGIDRFGLSAPGPICFEKLGLTAENILKSAHKILG